MPALKRDARHGGPDDPPSPTVEEVASAMGHSYEDIASYRDDQEAANAKALEEQDKQVPPPTNDDILLAQGGEPEPEEKRKARKEKEAKAVKEEKPATPEPTNDDILKAQGIDPEAEKEKEKQRKAKGVGHDSKVSQPKVGEERGGYNTRMATADKSPGDAAKSKT
jgi:hypothetical protein